MREKILEIAKKLENFEITEKEAHKQFLFLFGVNKSTPKCRIPEGEVCYRPQGGNCRSLNCEYFY